MDNHTLHPEAGQLCLVGQRLRLIPDLQLNPKGMFYPFVMTYLVASAGLTPVYDRSNYPNFMHDTRGIFPGVYSDGVSVNLGDCVTEARSDQPKQRDAEIAMCCMLANIAYESVKDRRNADCSLSNNPEFEVLRHVRNAASHGNKWHFKESRLARRGEWRGLVIDHRTKAQLQDKQCLYGSIQPADLLYLLGDIEKALGRP